ncbi:MAG: tail protein X [Rubrivivax sp.]
MNDRSRYADARPFVWPEGETPPFRGARVREIGRATGVLEHTWTATDRLDLLALHYYGDATRWWRILDANPEVLCGLDLLGAGRVGQVILIPPADEATR